MKNDFIICLIGCSGSGKTTVAELLEKDGYKAVQSYTTRKPRFEGEQGHTFVTDEEFDKLEDILAYNEYNGYRYCTTQEQIDSSDVYVVDIPGIKMLKEKYKGKKSILTFGLICSSKIVAERMRNRGDSEDAIKERLAYDAEAFADIAQYCDFLCNSAITTPEGIKSIIQKAAKILNKNKIVPLKNLQTGDIVNLGDNFVIIDKEKGTVTLAAEDSIAQIAFGDTGWKDSDIRKYLNEEYLYKLTKHVKYDDICGIKTQDVWDKISLMDKAKFFKYEKRYVITEPIWLVNSEKSGWLAADIYFSNIFSIKSAKPNDLKCTLGIIPCIVLKDSTEVVVTEEYNAR